MKCPNCQSNQICKNGHRRGKQNYQCKKCDRQFITEPSQVGYPISVQENCLKMYVNGMGFRAIETVTGINHNTVIRWVRKSANNLPNAPEVSEVPEITEIDELQTFVGKKNKRWLWTAVNHWQSGILAWVLGDCEASRRHRSSLTFKPLWKIIRGWQSFLYVTDGWKVYPCFINDCDHLILKTYMTRVEGENTRLRHCALERTASEAVESTYVDCSLETKNIMLLQV